MPAEGKPLLFIKQSVARARAESSVETIIAIDSVKTVPGLIADVCGRTPERLGLELDVLPVNEFRFYRDLFQAERLRRRLAAHPPGSKHQIRLGDRPA